MKKNLIASLLLLYSTTVDGLTYTDHFNDIQENSARSFMFTRPIFAHDSTEQAIWHNFINNNKNAMGGNFQIIGAYQQSRTDTAIDHYFLLRCKDQLLVAGDDTSYKECRDIRAEWIGLPSDFSGRMAVNPQQTQAGLTIEYCQDLNAFFDYGFFDGTWINVQFPFVWVQNKMNLVQFDVTPGTQTNPFGPTDIIQAFSQPAWEFGKIVNKRCRFELGALTVQMGRSFISERNGMQVSYYSGLVIPTGSKQDAEFLFDAVTGYNGHCGLNAGVRFNILLNKDTDYFSFCFFADLDDIFLIRNEQCRTLALLDPVTRIGKPLSRFIAFNTKCPDEQNVPGVNILTRTIRSRPYNIADFTTGFRVSVCQWLEFECGYGIWGHGEEKVILRNPLFFQENFGIAGTTAGTTANIFLSSVAQQGPDNIDPITSEPIFVPISECDLDMRAAASGPALNQKAFASLGIQKFGGPIEYFLASGFFLDFPHKNAALKTWGAWAKAGASF